MQERGSQSIGGRESATIISASSASEGISKGGMSEEADSIIWFVIVTIYLRRILVLSVADKWNKSQVQLITHTISLFCWRLLRSLSA